MRKFLLGFMIGAVLTAAFCFFYINAALPVKMGRLLDKDMIYLKTGQAVTGWITYEDGDFIILELEKGSVTLKRSYCRDIQKNIYLRYIRQLM